jgi:hypothetical protein
MSVSDERGDSDSIILVYMGSVFIYEKAALQYYSGVTSIKDLAVASMTESSLSSNLCNELDKQLNAWILPLVFDGLDVSGSIADYPRKLLPCHPSGFTGFFDCLPYRSKIEVKMIVPFVH